MEHGDDYREDMVDEYAFQMQLNDDLHMGSEELASWYEEPGN